MSDSRIYDKLLLPRGYLVQSEAAPSDKAPFYSAYLANALGVTVDKPMRLTAAMTKALADFFELEVPDSFYSSPQDTVNYTCDELALEQFVSYAKVEFEGENSQNADTFMRVPVFSKILPERSKGEEKVNRFFRIVTAEKAAEIVTEITDKLCAYTRPWSLGESADAEYIYSLGMYKWQRPACRDNIITMLTRTRNAEFAAWLDRKDVVKLSISLLGESSELIVPEAAKKLLAMAAERAQDCPMTKRQAKYFNTVLKKSGAHAKKADTSSSPYALSEAMVKNGDIAGAAKLLGKHGSLLARSLRWLLSRADEKQAEEVLDLLDGNPVVLMQMLWRFIQPDNGARVFVFRKSGMVCSHRETPEECAARRSVIPDKLRLKVVEKLRGKLEEYYSARPLNGKVYLSPAFRKVFVPASTAACGRGLDVYPTGSRLPISKFMRIFCYWKEAFDIDLTALIIDKCDIVNSYGWFNYRLKPQGEYMLHSGDARGNEGAEYIDISVDGLRADRQNKMLIFCVNGFNDMLNTGTICCGYQNKLRLDTAPWAPDNIAMRMNITSDSREYMAFAIDLVKEELIVLNLATASLSRVADTKYLGAISIYLSSDAIGTWNMYDLIAARSRLTDSPEQADIVFDDKYVGREGQKVIRPCDIPALINLI